ncbi:uncharacterized protein LOC124409530 [Diprion similis]|uniref:uncharacterized protein LOC124409530 n=1 Tax=Diprion similis TaxID=362088 RepID=UPI001EF8A127|nr:uncharacterized protein LOC124409530 [Diprion similis]
MWVAAAYRTASFVAAFLPTRAPPLGLVADARARAFNRMRELQHAGDTASGLGRELAAAEGLRVREQWKANTERSDLPSERIRCAIRANWEEWFNRSHGGMSFRLTQVMTGHGYFGSFQCRIGKIANPTCEHCGRAADTVEHTVEVCPAWHKEREILRATVGEDLTLTSLVRAMARSREGWAAVTRFADQVMTRKERAERESANNAKRERGGMSTETFDGC